MDVDQAAEGWISPQALSGLISAIYDCVLDPARWTDALSAIRHEIGAHNVAMTLQALPSGEVLLNVTDGIEPQWLERMPEYGADVVDLWGGPEAYLSLPLMEPLVHSRVAAPGYERNRYYREWVRPQGVVDALAVGLVRDVASVCSIGFGWHESTGAISAREIGMLRLLTPHLHRAIVITRLLEVRNLAVLTFETVFDSLRVPIVLVRRDLSVVHANQAAQTVFRRRMPLSVEAGSLVAVPRTAMLALEAAIDQIHRDENGMGQKGLGIPAVAADREPCALHVLPMRRRQLRHIAGADTVAAVFIASRTAPLPAPAQLVRALFGLTEAEHKVYEQLTSGSTVAQAAAALRVEASTIRTHLLKIFEKTGTHRQSELAMLAASIGATA